MCTERRRRSRVVWAIRVWCCVSFSSLIYSFVYYYYCSVVLFLFFFSFLLMLDMVLLHFNAWLPLNLTSPIYAFVSQELACKVYHLARPVKCSVFRTKAVGGNVYVAYFSMIFCIISVILKMYISVCMCMLWYYIFLLFVTVKALQGLIFYCLSYSTGNKYSMSMSTKGWQFAS